MQFCYSYLSIRDFNITSNQKDKNANKFKNKLIELNHSQKCKVHRKGRLSVCFDFVPTSFARTEFLSLFKCPRHFFLLRVDSHIWKEDMWWQFQASSSQLLVAFFRWSRNGISWQFQQISFTVQFNWIRFQFLIQFF